MIKNEELNNYIGKPVWDNVSKKWRVLAGYKRFDDNFWLAFTDDKYWRETNIYELNIYKEEISIIEPEPIEPTPEEVEEQKEV